MIFSGLVHVLATCLMRWKCVACGTTFRHFPPGVAPRKHYLPDSLRHPAKRYMEDPRATYRQVVNASGLPLRYAGEAALSAWSEAQKRREETRALSHTTIWRWMGFFAALAVLWRKRRQRRQTAADHVDLSPWTIHPGKYRGAERLRILIGAAQALEILSALKYPTSFETLYAGP